MKQCPKCGNTYTDETLSFCLTDGAVLEELDGPDTEPIPASQTRQNARVKIDLSEREQPSAEPLGATSVGSESGRSGVNIKIVVAIIVALLFLTALTSAVGVYFFFISSNGNSGLPESGNRSDNSEVEELKQRIEELSNRLENGSDNSQNAEDDPPPTPETEPTYEEDPEYDEEVIKRVNSPGDGFLALRDRPSASAGNRLAKIPHGDIVVMEGCQSNTQTIGGRTGRWCRVRWEGKTGWVFDVWLTD
ncbi:MAG: SH3 domain-containing protein [Acidobacteriota bacterium]|nr:MAG: SH3 domain-containing protein [Acidobacteriota bacterium]